MFEAIIFDTETTGFGDDAKIIEASWVAFDDSPETLLDYAAGVSFCQRYDPGVPSSLGALATHHILDSELVGCPPSEIFSLPDVRYLVGHNVDFDWRMAGRPDVKRICTLALSRMLFPDLDCHNLTAMAYFFLGDDAKRQVKNAHSAFCDVQTTRIVLSHLLLYTDDMGFPKTWDGLWEASERARIPTVMPFGKHKGTPISEVPRDYISWLLRQPDIDEYLRIAIERI